MKTTKTSKKAAAAETVAQAYDRNIAEFRSLLDRIQAQVDRRRRAGQQPAWDVVGSLAHTNEQLAIVLAGLGDRSAVDEKGIAY